jgi:hypothetical protein
MALPPIQYFRKEDFADVKESWPDILLPKLNELSRQATYGIAGNLSVSQNLLGFWWSGVVGNYKVMENIIFPFVPATIPPVPIRSAQATKAFPFSIPNKITPSKVALVMVAQASDVTEGGKTFQPALLGAVAWEDKGTEIRISAINGMVPDRCYNIRLLVLGE